MAPKGKLRADAEMVIYDLHDLHEIETRITCLTGTVIPLQLHIPMKSEMLERLSGQRRDRMRAPYVHDAE